MAKYSLTRQRFSVFRGEESRKCVLLYNKIASALVEYQYLFHKGWLQAMPSVIDALCVSLTYNDMWFIGYSCLYSPSHTNNLEYKLVFSCPVCGAMHENLFTSLAKKECLIFYQAQKQYKVCSIYDIPKCWRKSQCCQSLFSLPCLFIIAAIALNNYFNMYFL